MPEVPARMLRSYPAGQSGATSSALPSPLRLASALQADGLGHALPLALAVLDAGGVLELTQRALAHLLHVTERTVRRWELALVHAGALDLRRGLAGNRRALGLPGALAAPAAVSPPDQFADVRKVTAAEPLEPCGQVVDRVWRTRAERTAVSGLPCTGDRTPTSGHGGPGIDRACAPARSERSLKEEPERVRARADVAPLAALIASVLPRSMRPPPVPKPSLPGWVPPSERADVAVRALHAKAGMWANTLDEVRQLSADLVRAWGEGTFLRYLDALQRECWAKFATDRRPKLILGALRARWAEASKRTQSGPGPQGELFA